MLILPARKALLLPSLDKDAAAWVASVRTAGASVSDVQKRRVSALVSYLKSAGVWSLLDRLWLFAAENATQALTDLVARATATAVNSPTFTANRGYRGNGSSAYVNTGFNPTSGSPHYTQNAAHWGLWVETAQGTATMRLGGQDSSGVTEMAGTAAASTLYSYGVNQASGASSGVSNTALGSFHFVRTGASAIQAYHNGAQSATATNASIAIPNNNLFALAGNNAGTAFSPTDGRLSGIYAGGALTGTQVAAFHAALRAYMTAVDVS
jgi:hypothetical protein